VEHLLEQLLAGRRPVKRISTSSSGRSPASRIIRRARSTIFTALPMSSTKMPPSRSSGGASSRSTAPTTAACSTSPTASRTVMK
jgi:hypothetical protein